ncbi:extracellular calcium-sensing receptor-like [Phyllobates terribilis]|uniref:extracellular calcium-sensing receptor-like n=1 Tax=Phyllobates terribilis TaxID=111132 RepID=UPI003CCADC00
MGHSFHLLTQYVESISPFSSVSLLSNRRMFPSFFRTVLSGYYQSKGMAQLILRFGWTWIGLLALDNDYGLLGIQPIKEEIIKAGACVAFIEYIKIGQPDRNAPHIVKVIKESTATVVVVFANEVEFVPILNEMLKQNVTGKIFIGNYGWARSLLLSINKYFMTLSGSLSIVVNSYNIPGLSQFLVKINPITSPTAKWNKMMWETVFNCRFLPENQSVSFENPEKVCTGLENLENITKNSNYISSLKPTYYIFAAVHVIVKALDDLRNCKIDEGPFYNGICANISNFKPWQLTYYIRRVKVNLNAEKEKFFDENGNPPGLFTIVNWQLKADGTLTHVNIGTYNITSPLAMTMNSSLIAWKLGSNQIPPSSCSKSCTLGYRKVALQGKPTCCYACVPCLQGEISNQTDSIICFRCPWDQWPNHEKSMCFPKSLEFLSYEDLLGIILVTISIISSIFPVLILGLFFHKKNTPLVKASNYSLSCLLLISLSLCFLCSLGFIGYPDHDKCFLRQVSFGMIFTLCVACILAKTIMVIFAFMAIRPGSSLRNWSKFKASYSLITISCLLQFILCFTWLSTAPPFAQFNSNIAPEVIIVDCNEGSPIAFWAMLGYLFLLATISFIVAFLARRLPDSFNEAQFITFSMLAFLSVWISYIPASLSAQGKYTVAMEIFAILASSWSLLICMFLPKCFFILFRPEMNSREDIMRKNIDRRIYIQ